MLISEDVEEYRKIHFGGVYMIKLPLISLPDVCRLLVLINVVWRSGPREMNVVFEQKDWSVPKKANPLWVI